MLQDALREDKMELALIPNGVIPIVDPRLPSRTGVPPVFAARTVAAQAVNSDRREDILIWRYKKEHLEELGPFAETLVGFATHFIPSVQEGAARVGLLPQRGKKRGMFGFR